MRGYLARISDTQGSLGAPNICLSQTSATSYGHALRQAGFRVADLYLKALESERKALWATCRLKGLPSDTPERRRIAELDELLREHKAKTNLR